MNPDIQQPNQSKPQPFNGGAPLTPQQISDARAQLGVTDSSTPPTDSQKITMSPQDRMKTLGFNMDGTQIAPATQPQEPNFVQRVGTDLSQRGQQMTDVGERAIAGKQSIPETILQTLGTGAGFGLDILNEGVKSVLTGIGNLNPDLKNAVNTSVEALVKTPAVQAGLTELGKGIDAYQTWAKANPRPAANIESTFNIATLAPILASGVKMAEAAPGMISKTATNIKEAASGVKTAVSGTPEEIQAKFIKDLITPPMGTKDLTSAIKTGNVTEGAGLTGARDVTKAIPNFDKIQSAVSEVPNVSADKTLLENANAIHDHIGTLAQDLKSQLSAVETQVGKDRGFFTPNEFSSYMDKAKNTLAENPLLVGNAEQTANKILNKFSNLVEEKGYTPSGLLDARKALDTWMKAQKGESVFDPATEGAVSTALRTIRQGGNDFLASKVPDVPVKELLSKQSALYDAIENIAPKAAKEGANGLQQFIKAHPTIVKAAKIGVGAAGIGAIGGVAATHMGL